jgi:uncharacterized protein YpmS
MLLAILASVVIAAGIVAYQQFRAVPDWYVQQSVSFDDQKIAANNADQKTAQLLTWAAAVQAYDARKLRGDPGQSPPNSQTITLSDTELNAFIDAWQNQGLSEIQDKLSRYFTGGRFALADNRIILAGKSRDMGVIVSAQLEPSVDESGNLHLNWAGISAGDLNIPRTFFAQRLADVNAQLQNKLAQYQQAAQIDKTLNANTAAAQASITHWFLDALSGQPSDPTTFVPFDVGNFQNCEAVKLTNVQVANNALVLTFQSLSPSDRDAILSRLTAPYTEASSAQSP